MRASARQWVHGCVRAAFGSPVGWVGAWVRACGRRRASGCVGAWVRAWRGMRSPLAGRGLVKTWPITDRAAAARSGARFLHRSCAELRDGNLRRSGRLAVNASAARCRRTVGSRKELLRRALLNGWAQQAVWSIGIGIGTPWDPPKHVWGPWVLSATEPPQSSRMSQTRVVPAPPWCGVNNLALTLVKQPQSAMIKP